MIGAFDRHCILTLVDRKTGYLMIGKLFGRTTEAANRRAIALIQKARRKTRTITLDNGTEFHGYKAIEAATGATIYFATPHHSWERGTNENTNGLLREYFPKGSDLSEHTSARLQHVAAELNSRPRKRLDWDTPAERERILLGSA